MKSFETNKTIELAKSFKFYYDLRLIFWKSVYTKMIQMQNHLIYVVEYVNKIFF